MLFDWYIRTNIGGGLVGVGKFSFTFLSVGFDEFISFYHPIFENSRELYQQMSRLPTPSIVQVPGKKKETKKWI